MGKTLSETEKSNLSRFLVRRQLKDRAISLLGEAFNQNDLSRGELTRDQNASYKKIVDDISKAIGKGWIAIEKITKLLDDSELAGRQHICLYTLSGESAAKQKFFDLIANPSHVRKGNVKFGDYFDIPAKSFARVIAKSNEEVIVKIVSMRYSWDTQYLEDTASRKLIERSRVRERNAMIVRCSLKDNLLEIRVPPRESSNSTETSRSVYEHIETIFDRHYSDEWSQSVKAFPITDAFQKIIDNRVDFCLRNDAPESDTVRMSLSRKGKLEDLEDLRDDPLWEHSDGFGRSSIRGAWQVKDRIVFMHFNFDKVKINTRNFPLARLFVPYLCSNDDAIHAVRRIQQHL